MKKISIILVVFFSLLVINLVTDNYAAAIDDTYLKIRDAKIEQRNYDTMMMLGADTEEAEDDIAKVDPVKKPLKTNAEVCNNSLGEKSKYNTALKKCDCVDGYKLYKNKCIAKSEYDIEYCKETVGINSKYDSIKDICTTNEEYCKEKMGYGAKYSIGNEQCECMDGFVLSDNICVEEKKEEVKTETRPDSFSVKIVSFFQKLKFW